MNEGGASDGRASPWRGRKGRQILWVSVSVGLAEIEWGHSWPKLCVTWETLRVFYIAVYQWIYALFDKLFQFLFVIKEISSIFAAREDLVICQQALT